jgi:N-acetylglucosaminyldiphosphoundecaprenol N-acetyl-beta-D-mannosaminyltransferase
VTAQRSLLRTPVRRELLGTTVHAVSLAEALEWVGQAVATRNGGYVVTLNGAMLVQTASDPALREVVNGAGLVTADGIGVILAARIVGVDVVQRVAGVDLAEAVCARAASAGYRLYLLGGAQGVAAATAEALQTRFTGIQIVGLHHGFYRPDDEFRIIDDIKRARPDVLLVAFGAPRQEQWMRRWRRELDVPVAIGVGGSLDVLAGRTPRAPRWMRRLGLEWLFRALREPRRWGVVRTIPPLFLLALRERWRKA